MVPSKKKKRKKVKSGKLHAPTKQVREGRHTGSDHLTICWHLGKFDWDGPWGNASCKKLDFRELLEETVSKWEQMTWAQIYSASGGKVKGNNNHPVQTSELSRKALQRLRSIYLEDTESLVSLRVNSTTRFYGIRDDRTFQFLWYDPWHGDKNKAVNPVRRK